METSVPVAPNAVTGIAGRERVRAFDLAAGLAVFFMILVHVLWHWGAVVATNYLSRFAVHLESSWWIRRESARRSSEVAVEVPTA